MWLTSSRTVAAVPRALVISWCIGVPTWHDLEGTPNERGERKPNQQTSDR